jgi:general stress protein 26
MAEEELYATIRELLSAQKDMTIATNRPDGFPQATVVSFVNEGTDIYFGCGEHSQKAENIARDDRVSCTITAPYTDWNDIRGLSLGGHAARIADPGELQRIEQLFIAKFPQVMDYAGGSPEGVAFIRVRPKVVSVLDYTKGFGHSDLVYL